MEIDRLEREARLTQYRDEQDRIRNERESTILIYQKQQEDEYNRRQAEI